MNDLIKSLDLFHSPEKGLGAFPIVSPPFITRGAGGPPLVVVMLAAAQLIA